MKKIFLFLVLFLVSCSSPGEDISQTGSSDETVTNSGGVLTPQTLSGTQDGVASPELPPVSPIATNSGNSNTPSSINSVTVTEEEEKDMEEIVDEADKNIEALIEEIFGADEQK